MDPYELNALVSTLAFAIAKNTPDDEELLQISIMIDFLSDSLDAIIAQRALIKRHSEAAAAAAEIIIEE